MKSLTKDAFIFSFMGKTGDILDIIPSQFDTFGYAKLTIEISLRLRE